MNQVHGSTPRATEIAGLWRRLIAFLVDGLILGLLGAGIGLIAFDRLVALGDWGRAVGFVIALAYFGVMDSRLAGGQTLGKQLLGIQVVTAGGAPLSLGASTLRAVIFCVPYFLNGAVVDPGPGIAWLLVFLVFGVGISIAYLLLFNRRTGQSLHDLATRAYVVHYKSDGPVRAAGRISPVHFGVVGAILMASLALPVVMQRLARAASISGLLSIQQGLQEEPDVWHASVARIVNKAFSDDHGATTTHVFSARIFYSRRVVFSPSLAARAVQVILARDPSIAKEDRIVISMTYGYDIGIASAWRSQNFAYTPAQWQQQISLHPTAL